LPPKIEQIAANMIQLLPLLQDKLFKPALKNASNLKKQSDLTHLQFHILEELFHTKTGISMTQLAKSINVSKQQLTPLVNKLEEKDYVIKMQDVNDRRYVKLMLTEKGKNIVSKRWEDIHCLIFNRISHLSEDELIDLDYAINKILRIINKLE
jgi:DNA-binding MarR family transcriptional regulator